jgi:hypothetical protein
MRRSLDSRLRTALGAFWLLDGLLQLQPFMFTRHFAADVIAPAAGGQPRFVAGPVHWAAHLIAAQPVLLNTAFALVQLALGLALLLPRLSHLTRAALVASIAWSLSVWYLGEGLGGLASGHAMLLTGAPGAVLLYAVLAVAAWPTSANPRAACRAATRSRVVIGAWAALWAAGAVYQLLPGQHTSTDVSGAIADAADGTPAGVAALLHPIAHLISQHPSFVLALTAAEAVIAVLALLPGRSRQVSAVAGGALALAFWIVGQSFGELLSGQSTDPNSGPLLVVLAVAIGLAGRGTSDSRRSVGDLTPPASAHRPDVTTRPARAAA